MDKKKRASISVGILVAGLVAAGSTALPQQPSKLGLVNSQKAFETSNEGKKVISQLLDREQKIRNEIAKLDGQIQSLETKYNTQKLTLAAEAVVQMEAEINRKMTERKRYEEDATKDYQQLRANLFNRIKNEMVPIIQATAKDRGLEIVLDMVESGVVYFSPSVDITDEVIKKYNASRVPAK
jgi:outer membrane protein